MYVLLNLRQIIITCCMSRWMPGQERVNRSLIMSDIYAGN